MLYNVTAACTATHTVPVMNIYMHKSINECTKVQNPCNKIESTIMVSTEQVAATAHFDHTTTYNILTCTYKPECNIQYTKCTKGIPPEQKPKREHILYSRIKNLSREIEEH